MNVLPLFSSHYSFNSILTLDREFLKKESNPTRPDSILEICCKNNIKDVFLVDKNLGGFLSFYMGCKDAELNPRFGYKITCCADVKDKSTDSRSTEHKIIVWALDEIGYNILKKFSSECSIHHFYYVPRCDETILKKYFNSQHIAISIPFYDSFLFNNLLTNSTCIFDAEYFNSTLFMEDSDLPFDVITQKLVNNYSKKTNLPIQKTRTIYYKHNLDFKAYMIYRIIQNRTTFSVPNIDFMSSDKFSFEEWQKQNG